MILQLHFAPSTQYHAFLLPHLDCSCLAYVWLALTTGSVNEVFIPIFSGVYRLRKDEFERMDALVKYSIETRSRANCSLIRINIKFMVN